ncbi:hypothetical protein K8R33_01115 [archaeon]|nr:hypothetical protein [archaeon]
MEENNNFGDFPKPEDKKIGETPKINKKTNSWKIATFVFGILFVVSILTGSSLSALSISGNTVAIEAVDFINTNLLVGSPEKATLEDSEKASGVKATISIAGQQTPIFITNDGEMMYLNAIPLTQQIITEPQESPEPQEQPVVEVSTKSDKPTVELFIMSHCPYGTQAEKGILPVIETLSNKIDFDLKFVYYAMHGEKEVNEQANQYCIQKEQKDKLLDYLYCFLGSQSGSETEATNCRAEVGINEEMLTTCIESANTEFDLDANLKDESSWLSGQFPLFNIDKEDNEKYSVRGSPTLVVNGETVNSGRDSISLLKAICSAFNVAPEECNTKFEVGSPTPGFGFEKTTQANAATAGCGI